MCDPQNRSNYVVTTKLDGIRMLAIIGPSGLFLIDRALIVYYMGTSPPDTVTISIYDGELMPNQLFMVFDTMRVDDRILTDRPFGDRYERLCVALVPRNADIIPETMLRLVPKRMYRLIDIEALLGVMDVSSIHSFTIQLSDVMHPGCVRTIDTELDSQSADGLIFMDRSDHYSFTRSDFGLLKWKLTPTYDVLVEMKDLCRLDGVPRYSSRVPTHYVEYSERMRRPVRHSFVVCVIPKEQRVRLWEEKMGLHRSATLCVECFYDGSQWSILQGRPHKRRSNSGRTIRDTWWLEQENITRSALLESVTAIQTTDASPPLLCEDAVGLRWLDRTWRVSSTPCELEVRLLYKNKTSIPIHLFRQIIQMLRVDPELIGRESRICDYTCGHLRVTQQGDETSTIEKEIGFRRDLAIPGHPLLGMRCVFSYEHPKDTDRHQNIQATFSTLRRKHRWSFLHPGRFVIDCTHVQSSNWRGERGPESYEIEIELVSSRQGSARVFPGISPVQMLIGQLRRLIPSEFPINPLIPSEDR
jgi:hypothetical protein